ncbi:MAG TPA: DUF4124 domain-containing protein [Rhodanobacter sp.]|nr:DUF4124 domain-containing protein [Rhodanobacter sp.]
MHPSAILLCLILLLRSTPALAQTEIHHCIGAGGGAVFTDQPCTALHATAVAPTAKPGNHAAMPAPPPILCAADPAALRQSVIDAFARHDANRLAGLMLWDDYGERAAVSDIRLLGELVSQPLLGLDMPGQSPGGPDETTSSTDAGSILPFPEDSQRSPVTENTQLILHLGGDGINDRRFDVVARAGCLWLRNTD